MALAAIVAVLVSLSYLTGSWNIRVIPANAGTHELGAVRGALKCRSS